MVDARPTSRAPAVRRRFSRPSGEAIEWGIAVETPVEIGINGAPWTLMLATPADYEDLAIGLAHTERAVTDVRAIERVVVADYLDGVTVDLVVPARFVDEASRRRRSMEGRTGCGLCGVESLASLPRPTRTGSGDVHVSCAAILRAFAALSESQPLNRETHSVHGAAWCSLDGAVVFAREDVGRHNALDKVLGARLRAKSAEPGFVAMTSRCSFELVYKAVAGGAAALATLSAPTSLALEWSETLGLPIACRGANGEVVTYANGAPHAA
jgi:FdhD protein